MENIFQSDLKVSCMATPHMLTTANATVLLR